MKRVAVIITIIVGALVVTALGIDAADTWEGKSGTLLSNLLSSEATSMCPKGMQHIETAQTFSCVDTYEASAASVCPKTQPNSPLDTRANLDAAACSAVSDEVAEPWRYVTREEAEVSCARAGKRLPTAVEWYIAARDTRAEHCNVAGGAVVRGSANTECVSVYGVHHMVGNVWEWVSDDVINGSWQNRTLPASGYVTQVDIAGIATETSPDTRSEIYQGTYFWSGAEGAFGMIRGGFYNSRSDAGVAAVHAGTAPTFAGEAVGFRCVK